MPLMTAAERIGSTIDGKYRLDRILGEGGMGVVYEGMHVRLGRAVAVKFLHPQFSQNAEVVQRFVREAQSAARLQHPNVVDVRDIDTAEDGALYMVLELLSGESLAKHLTTHGELTLDATLTAITPCMDAVALAHEHGIVHRDLKPDNLYLSRTPAGNRVPKVLDFGIAKLAHGAGAGSTGTGSVIGTPAYMAPEQAMGKKEVGPAADVWSMGIVLYECLTGRLPFDFPEDASPTAVIVTVVTGEPYPISRFRRDLSPAVAQVLDQSLAKEVSRRFPTMRAFLDALRTAVTTGVVTGPHHTMRDATGPHMTNVPVSQTGPGAWSVPQTGAISGSEIAAPVVPATPSMHGATPFVSGGTIARLEDDIVVPKRPIAVFAGIGVVALVAIIGLGIGLSGSGASTTDTLAGSGTTPGVTAASLSPPVAEPPTPPAAPPVVPPVAPVATGEPTAVPTADPPVAPPVETAPATGGRGGSHTRPTHPTSLPTTLGHAVAPVVPPVVAPVTAPPVVSHADEEEAEPPRTTARGSSGGSRGSSSSGGSSSSSSSSSSGGTSPGRTGPAGTVDDY